MEKPRYPDRRQLFEEIVSKARPKPAGALLRPCPEMKSGARKQEAGSRKQVQACGCMCSSVFIGRSHARENHSALSVRPVRLPFSQPLYRASTRARSIEMAITIEKIALYSLDRGQGMGSEPA